MLYWQYTNQTENNDVDFVSCKNYISITFPSYESQNGKYPNNLIPVSNSQIE